MDFDADGKKDVLSGSYPGELYLFKGQGGGAFAPADTIKHADGKPVKVGMAAAPYAHDWDGDGDLDLLVGDIEGQIHLVPNEGSRSAPKFGTASPLKAGGNVIKVAHGDAGPTVADWDGDGKFDLISGAGAGGAVWFRNTGSNEEPQLAASQTLVSPKDQGGPPVGMRTKVHATDWNGDGKLDLLVGDFAMDEAKPVEQTEEQKAARKAKADAWLAEYKKVKDAPDDESTEHRKARMAKIASLIAEFRKINEADGAQPAQAGYHGYVWLFLRQEGVAAAR